MPKNSPRIALLGCLLALGLAPAAQAYAPLQMGIHDPGASGGAELPFQRIQESGASITREAVLWSSVAPGGDTKPAGFDARDPGAPAYNWTTVDGFVRAAAARGLSPLLTTYAAPAWAEGDDAADHDRRFGDAGTYHPNAKHYGDFMFAMAKRYSGSYTPPGQSSPLPQVKLFQAWNEPNFGQYLTSKRQSDIPVYYAKLLNAFYDNVKSVSRSNLVIAAGLGPYGNNGHATDVDPQLFMRTLMCLSGKGGERLRAVRSCRVPKPKFDIWSQHPYTFGGKPTTSAISDDGASLGNMGDVVRTLKFAVRKRKVLPRGSKRLWVTEFAWFSNPPGLVAGSGKQLGLPFNRHAAYLSESAYRLWRQGFSAYVWYSLEDLGGFPSGLFSGSGADAQPKPAFTAFRFPFYAEASRSGILVWGLASGAGKTTVRIERQSGSSFRSVGELSTDRQGMFYTRLRGGRGTYRAVVLSGPKKDLQSLTFTAR
jgi:hypothetical protein